MYLYKGEFNHNVISVNEGDVQKWKLQLKLVLMMFWIILKDHGLSFVWKMDEYINLYIVDVDDEFQRNDEEDEPELKAIVYNTTGSNSYGNDISFSDIDEIELYKSEE